MKTKDRTRYKKGIKLNTSLCVKEDICSLFKL